MKNLLIIFIVWFCGVQLGWGQKCGSEHDTDLDGKYTSSTSSDPCSNSALGSESSPALHPNLLNTTETFLTLHPFDKSRYQLSQSLESQNKLIHSIRLCHMGVLLNYSPEMTTGMALSLFRVATIEPDIKLSVIGQKNAVSCLSHVDPAAAMELLLRVNFQRPEPGKWVYEDPRYNAAETTFINFLQLKPLDITRIAEEARYLGRTGQYPYVAVARVVHGMPISLKNEASALLNDALLYYKNETGFYNRDEEFLHLLQLLPDSVVDEQLAAQILAIFVTRLNNNPIHLPGDYYAEIQIDSNGEILSFTDRNEVFLFQAFPIIRRFNPILAAQLSQHNRRLVQAVGKMSYISGGFVQGNITSEQARRQHLEWLQHSLITQIQRIEECGQCDQQMAVRLVRHLTGLNFQLVGFSAIDRNNTTEQ